MNVELKIVPLRDYPRYRDLEAKLVQIADQEKSSQWGSAEAGRLARERAEYVRQMQELREELAAGMGGPLLSLQACLAKEYLSALRTIQSIVNREREVLDALPAAGYGIGGMQMQIPADVDFAALAFEAEKVVIKLDEMTGRSASPPLRAS